MLRSCSYKIFNIENCEKIRNAKYFRNNKILNLLMNIILIFCCDNQKKIDRNVLINNFCYKIYIYKGISKCENLMVCLPIMSKTIMRKTGNRVLKTISIKSRVRLGKLPSQKSGIL